VIASVNNSGIWTATGSSIVSVGTPSDPVWFTRYSTIQEQPMALGYPTPSSAFSVNPYHYDEPRANGTFRFSRFSIPANGGYHLYHYTASSFESLSVQDCEFWNGINYFGGATNSSAVLRNNLFVRSQVQATSSGVTSLSFSNNLVWGAAVRFDKGTSDELWQIHNNAFDSVIYTGFGFPAVSNSYNAFINCDKQLNPTNAFNVVGGGFIYTNGPLGSFYHHTTNLVNKGSVTADVAGLYHHTTRTSQDKEATSVVDIGFHYVALDGNGLPVDTDGDGSPDYLEDVNGNGNTGDDPTSWQTYNSPNGLGSGQALQVFTPLQ
jgi:hypothetical protein